MKEHEPSPLAFEYPPPDSYFLRQQHADSLVNNNTDAGANADTVYKELSLLAKFEAAGNETGGVAAHSNSQSQPLSQTLPSTPIHVLLDGTGGRVSVLSSGSTVAAVGFDNSSNGGPNGSRGTGDLSVTQSDEPTSSSNNKSKSFQATISTNTRGSSSPLTIETTNSFQQDALPQASNDIVAGNDGIDVIDDGYTPSDASGGPMAAVPMYHSDSVTDGPSAPPERRASRLPVPTVLRQSKHIQLSQLQQLQLQQQNQHQQSTNPTDAEDKAISVDIHHRVDNEVIQSRVDIKHRRQSYNSTKPHLRSLPFPPAVARTPQSSSKVTATRRRVSKMPAFDRRHKFARRDYTSPTYLEDYVLTRRGSINDKVWTTSLTPRATVLPFGLAIGAKKQELQGLKASGAATSSVSETSPSSLSSLRWSRWLPDLSPGHEIHPPTEPGPVFGVNPPRFTHKYALYDVPFYGIENVEISSSRYRLWSQSDPSSQLEEARDDALQDGRRDNSGAGVGTGGDGGDGVEAEDGSNNGRPSCLSDHREHIWSVAHEDEYGPETGVGAVEMNRMLRERLKRAHRILPIVRSTPPVVGSSASGSGSGSGSTEAQQTQRFREGADLRIDVDQGSHVEISQMTVSSMASRSTNSTKNQSVQFIPMNRHGRGHGHGQVPRRPCRPRPVSEGVYGLDTFQESLELIKYVPERPTGRWAKLMAIIRQHWRSWICVGSMSVAAIIITVILLKKKGGDGDSKGMASAGQGGGDGGGDDPRFDNGEAVETMMKEPSSGEGRTIVTMTATPSSTRSVTATPTSTSTLTSSLKSSAAPTSKAATARRTKTARQSTNTRTSSRRSKVARIIPA